MRAPLLGLPKPIYYLDIIRLTDLWEFFVAYSLSNNRKVEHFYVTHLSLLVIIRSP